ncbi:MAG: SGNH/GDSL hydrolase family protein [Prolixibacteraceae bacterium]
MIKFFSFLPILLLFIGIKANAQDQIKRENIEWLDVWLPETNSSGLPRVLLIGNSITRQYFKEVEQQLKGKAFVGRLSTSKSLGDPGLLKEIELVMGYHHFDVIHFNNGMHGWDYPEKEYARAFPGLLRVIRKCAPDAKLIWASTTPVRMRENMKNFAERNSRVIERNRLVAEMLKNEDVAINDLYSVVEADPVFYQGGDGVHPAPAGVKALAKQVSGKIREALGENPAK